MSRPSCFYGSKFAHAEVKYLLRMSKWAKDKIKNVQDTVDEHEEKLQKQNNIEEKIAEIVEEQERVHVCHRDEIQKLQETVREQEEKIEKLTDVIWCVHISLGDWVKHFQSTPKTPYNPFDDLE